MTDALAKSNGEHALDVARELPAMFQLAKALMGARGFVPKHLDSEGAIVACILAGRELGIPPMLSLRTINVIDGKVSLSAELQLALMKRAGVRHSWTTATDTEAVLVLTRQGDEPHTQRYTWEDAKRAGLTGKNNWRNHPAAMLRARCVSAAATAYAPDVLGGVYDPDELEEIASQPRGLAAEVAEAHPEHAAAIEQDARDRQEQAPLVDEWGAMLDKLNTEEAFEAWTYHHGHLFEGLQRNVKGRVWTRLKNTAKRLGMEIDKLRDGPQKDHERFMKWIEVSCAENVTEEDEDVIDTVAGALDKQAGSRAALYAATSDAAETAMGSGWPEDGQ